MTEWLLILSLYRGGITTVKLPDLASCQRASKAFLDSQTPSSAGAAARCVEVRKEIQ